MLRNYSFYFVLALECRDIEMALYVRPQIVQYSRRHIAVAEE